MATWGRRVPPRGGVASTMGPTRPPSPTAVGDGGPDRPERPAAAPPMRRLGARVTHPARLVARLVPPSRSGQARRRRSWSTRARMPSGRPGHVAHAAGRHARRSQALTVKQRAVRAPYVAYGPRIGLLGICRGGQQRRFIVGSGGPPSRPPGRQGSSALPDPAPRIGSLPRSALCTVRRRAYVRMSACAPDPDAVLWLPVHARRRGSMTWRVTFRWSPQRPLDDLRVSPAASPSG